jgi:putative membrane protein
VSAPSIPDLLVAHWRAAWALNVQIVLYAGLYLWGATRVRRWPVVRTGAFLAGLLCVVLALESGLDSFDDRLLSVHMTQHLVLLLLAPVLLLTARPVTLALRAVPRGSRRSLARLLRRVRRITGPLPSLAIFYAVVGVTHLPWFYDATVRHAGLHELEHAAYLLCGMLLWWPVLDGDPVPSQQLGGIGKLVYVIAAMPSMALIGAYLNRQPTLVYSAYAAPAHVLGVSPVLDQQRAGAIMWVAGGSAMALVGLSCALAALIGEERRQRARDARAAVMPGGQPSPRPRSAA